MNERIKELAEQARIKDHWSIDEARYLTNYLDEQKFAELIVGECIRKIEDIAESSDNPRPIYRVAVELLEHFGVEE